MSQFTRRVMAYTVAIIVAGVIGEGYNYWQGTPPTVSELRWLLLCVGIGGGLSAVGLTADLGMWLWRRRKSN